MTKKLVLMCSHQQNIKETTQPF